METGARAASRFGFARPSGAAPGPAESAMMGGTRPRRPPVGDGRRKLCPITCLERNNERYRKSADSTFFISYFDRRPARRRRCLRRSQPRRRWVGPVARARRPSGSGAAAGAPAGPPHRRRAPFGCWLGRRSPRPPGRDFGRPPWALGLGPASSQGEAASGPVPPSGHG